MAKADFLIKFKKPYAFEGTEHKEIDLSGLEKLTARDLIDAEKQFAAGGGVAPITEMSLAYACIIAAKAAKKPEEFFYGLPAPEVVAVKNIVTNFFYS